MIRTAPKKAPPKKRGRQPLGTTEEHLAAGRVIVKSIEPNGIVYQATEDIRIGSRKRGRPVSGNAKVLLALRLDVDVIEKFRATGPGWQVRMAEALKAAVV